MPPHLLSNLIRVLRYSSPNIQKFQILHVVADTRNCPHYVCSDITASFAYRNSMSAKAASMENPIPIKFSESKYTVLLSDKKANEVASFSY